MKYIQKNNEPQWFKDWKADNPNATYADLVSSRKAHSLRQSLVEEQHYICCYCECLIDAETSHNEHFKPKGNLLYRSLQLDYNNIFASCKREADGDPETHCGHKKSDSFDVQLVSPMEPNCSTHFKYDLNGQIFETDDRGKLTIEMLKLDSALLNASRKSLIDHFIYDVDPDNLDQEIANHLDVNREYYGEFYTTIEYLNSHGLL